jgi:predicted  nucleic acid-binding Zn-ribbon protein
MTAREPQLHTEPSSDQRGGTPAAPPLSGDDDRLSDGSRFYGVLGELARDEDEDLVQCHLCGGWFRAIGGSHLRRAHGWTLDEYRDAFRLPRELPTCARSMSRRASELVQDGLIGTGARDAPLPRGVMPVRPWRTLAVQHPGLAAQLHPTHNPGVDPAVVAAASSRPAWWVCAMCGHEWLASPQTRGKGHGCPACYARRRRYQGPMAPAADGSLARLHPAVAAEWDGRRNGELTPERVRPGSHLKAWWRCGACGHRWEALVHNRTQGHGCPRCGVRRRAKLRSEVPYERSLAARFPHLAAELDCVQDEPIDAARLGASSGQRVWWHCRRCGHRWRALVSARTRGKAGCPRCPLVRHSTGSD